MTSSRFQRLSRIIELLALVQAQPRRWNAKSLARLFEVSEKRIYDDLSELTVAKIYLHFEETGYVLDTRFMPPPLPLTDLEALTLHLALDGFSRGRGRLRTVARTALNKLRCVIPPETQELVGRVSIDHKGHSEVRDYLERIQQAIAGKKALSIRYFAFSEGKTYRREVAPYALFFRKNAWYFCGHDSVFDEVRTFRINRIRSLKETENTFELPGDFSLDAYLEGSWHIWSGAPIQVEAIFSERIRPLIEEHEWQKGEEKIATRGGRLIYRCTVRGQEEIKQWLLGWGGEVEVVAPKELRAEMAREAKGMAAMYRADET